MSNYWRQKATPWVSFAVLAGGMLTAVILFFLVIVEASILELDESAYEYLES